MADACRSPRPARKQQDGSAMTQDTQHHRCARRPRGRGASSEKFHLVAKMHPRGDQPQAIAALSEGVERGRRFQTLLGVTGSGKTFTMANVIARVQKPALVIAHNKTLAAQLYGEFRDLFPENAVEFFVSYYDYYQPEAYIPATDTYIEKETLINDDIERMRHSATRALQTREDVIVVASVSCIYGLGTARSYFQMAITVHKGGETDRDELLRRLVAAHYRRSDIEIARGSFRVCGDTVEVFPAYEGERAVRIELFGDRIECLTEFDPLHGGDRAQIEKVTIYPGSHYVTETEQRSDAITAIRVELKQRLGELRAGGKRVEAERLERRTLEDVEMLEEFGYCPGIENYARHLAGRAAGEPPPCLLDYFPRDFLVFIDESHQTVPQIAGMYRGDRSRKETLVGYGFRLPSAIDNRPLTFREFEERAPQAVFVSATPGDYELKKSAGHVVEQLIRPTGLIEPEVEVRPAKKQVDDLLGEIRERASARERVLVTCLTKRMAEDLSDYYFDLGVKCRYLHADIETLERVRIIRDLRLGVFDVLIGINLLREGLDIPECSLVGILDADKEGFLRSHISLIQTIGRASRHPRGKAILYADLVTDSMKIAIEETRRRRARQQRYNREHGITPQAVRRNVLDFSAHLYDAAPHALPLTPEAKAELLSKGEIAHLMADYSAGMQHAAAALDFEAAAQWRDRLQLLREMELGLKLPARKLLAAIPSPREHRHVGHGTRASYWHRYGR
jgi:excinuclease ABC subunit B